MIVLDLGGVLSWPSDLYSTPSALLGVSPDAYEAAYWQRRAELDHRLPPDEYYSDLLTRLDVDPTPGLVRHLSQLDMSLWCRFRPSAIDMLRELGTWGERPVILSNAPATLREAAERSDWYPLVGRLFISAELGLVKPDRRLYAQVTDELEVAPGDVAFIDDRADNVAAAAAFGWRAHRRVDDGDSLAWLRHVNGAAAAGPGSQPQPAR